MSHKSRPLALFLAFITQILLPHMRADDRILPGRFLEGSRRQCDGRSTITQVLIPGRRRPSNHHPFLSRLPMTLFIPLIWFPTVSPAGVGYSAKALAQPSPRPHNRFTRLPRPPHPPTPEAPQNARKAPSIGNRRSGCDPLSTAIPSARRCGGAPGGEQRPSVPSPGFRYPL